jgi:hypothetical protein
MQFALGKPWKRKNNQLVEKVPLNPFSDAIGNVRKGKVIPVLS